LKSVKFQNVDTLVSFDVVSLFSNVPVDEGLKIIRNKLHNDNTSAELSVLQFEAIIELLEVCLRTTYFRAEDSFFKQKDGKAMGSTLSPIVSNIFMEHCKKLAIDLTWRNTNHRCGSGMLMDYMRSGLMAQSGYRISSTTSIVLGLPSSLLLKCSQTVLILFWMFWSSGKGRHWPSKFTERPPTLADISTSDLTIRRM
jgi:hypothetical protein